MRNISLTPQQIASHFFVSTFLMLSLTYRVSKVKKYDGKLTTIAQLACDCCLFDDKLFVFKTDFAIRVVNTV